MGSSRRFGWLNDAWEWEVSHSVKGATKQQRNGLTLTDRFRSCQAASMVTLWKKVSAWTAAGLQRLNGGRWAVHLAWGHASQAGSQVSTRCVASGCDRRALPGKMQAPSPIGRTVPPPLNWAFALSDRSRGDNQVERFLQPSHAPNG